MTEPTRTEPQRIELPSNILRAIELIIADTETTASDSYVAAVLITYGYALWKRHTGDFDPTLVQIPEPQWHEICGWLITTPGLGDDDIARVNHGLDWMNQGPSSYKPEAVQS